MCSKNKIFTYKLCNSLHPSLTSCSVCLLYNVQCTATLNVRGQRRSYHFLSTSIYVYRFMKAYKMFPFEKWILSLLKCCLHILMRWHFTTIEIYFNFFFNSFISSIISKVVQYFVRSRSSLKKLTSSRFRPFKSAAFWKIFA